MRILIYILLFISFQITIKGQDITEREKPSKVFITDVFIKLNEIGLSRESKKELLSKHRISQDKETETTIEVDTINNSIFIQSCFIGSMTMPCDNFYIKLYCQNENVYEIVFSSSSISFADKHQNTLKVYHYDLATRVLSEDTVEYKAFKIVLKDFFKENTPDSILMKYAESVNPYYSFNGAKITCNISDTGYSNNLLKEPFLKGNVIEIEWNGNTFMIKKIILEKDQSDCEDN